MRLGKVVLWLVVVRICGVIIVLLGLYKVSVETGIRGGSCFPSYWEVGI
jgi:hypothetical protein